MGIKKAHCENYSWPLAIFGSELQAITKPLPHVKKVIFQNCFGIWLVKFGIRGQQKLQVYYQNLVVQYHNLQFTAVWVNLLHFLKKLVFK